MLYLDLNKQYIKKDKLNKLINYFLQGKIIALPSDTIYGLSCLAKDKKALQRIFRIKERSSDRSVLILISSLKMLYRYAIVSKKQEEIIKKIWFNSQFPSTIILDSKKKLSLGIENKEGSIAVRLPKSKFLTKMIKELDEAIVSTSINVSGQRSINTWTEIEDNFFNKIDYCVRLNTSQNNKVSRLIDLRDEEIKIIRK